WQLQDFYRNVHVPPVDRVVAPEIQNVLCNSNLYPFQARAVDWMLEREGVQVQDGEVVSSGVQADVEEQAPSFEPVSNRDGRQVLISHLRRMVLLHASSVPEGPNVLRGGILAEEMGLGKTVELIALLNLHKRKIEEPVVHDVFTDTEVRASKATLIITPPSILEQWKNEIEAHAPHLKVFHYKGMPRSTASAKRHKEASVEHLLDQDVVLTTYQVLSTEIYYTTGVPERTSRHAKKYERRRSPLIQISWWRCCLDEAQKIETGVSRAATVARLIPRCNAWAVSGTPLQNNVHDLLGLLIFLRFEPFCDNKPLWNRVDKKTFKAIFSRLALRHNKDQIRNELRLPPQKRVVILSPFTAVEEQNYNQLFQQLCDECWVTPDGSPMVDDWDPKDYAEKMKAWLTRLRQTCLHPQVGGSNRRALGRGAPLRTVEEVLDVMIDINARDVRTTERENILEHVLWGHILGNDKSNANNRMDAARPKYETALKQADRWVDELRNELNAERKRLALADGEDGDAADEAETDSTNDEDGHPDAQKKGRLGVIQRALRSALEVQHICAFFIGTSYFQKREALESHDPPLADADELQVLERKETEYYDMAKAIRKEILKDIFSKAERTMQTIRKKVESETWVKITDMPAFEDYGGIENYRVLEHLDKVQRILNRQGAQLDKWRGKVVRNLLLPLVDEDEEAKGDEYEESTKAQDELPVYVTMLRALVADRHLALTGQTNELVDHEMKFASGLADKKQGPCPELFLELRTTQEELRPGPNSGSLRNAIAELRSIATNLQWQADDGNARAKAEVAIAERQLKEAQKTLTAQSKVVAELEKELELYRGCMNVRNEFYRQLQQISDTVLPYKEQLDDTLDVPALQRLMNKESKTSRSLAELKTKQRFLQHLKEESTGTRKPDQQRTCTICMEPFRIGVLTVCGHIFCKECIGAWIKERRTCPVCKRWLKDADFHNVTYKPRELQAQEETQTTTPGECSEASSRSPVSTSSAIYSDMSPTTMNEINSKDLNGSFGTKIDTIARHILWLRDNDPGAKSIVFSQFSDFLDVLGAAFREFRIGFSSIGEKEGIGKFRREGSTEVFLLDAKHDSSGLNLVNAAHVFLCEPLINPAIELQAIARVHRIGQQRATTVYMYLIRDTVEENIYAISVGRRLAHMGKSSANKSPAQASGAETETAAVQERALDKANSLELQQAALARLVEKKGAGEKVDSGDVWSCLFSNARGGLKAAAGRPELATELARHLRAEAAEGR
ncbi:hypothetical protein K490DRAFT_3522, partial [Saccharata proteae CBS 121410]